MKKAGECRLFSVRRIAKSLHLVYYSLESLWVVQRQICKDLPVQFDSGLVALPHELGVAHAVLA